MMRQKKIKTVFHILPTLTLWLWASDIWGNPPSPTKSDFEAAITMHHCAQRLGSVGSHLERIDMTWIRDVGSRFHVLTNFKILLAGHRTYLEELASGPSRVIGENAGGGMAGSPLDLVRDLDHGRIAFHVHSLDELARGEELFILTLSDIERALTASEGEIGELSGNCLPDFKDTIDQFTSYTAKIKEQLTKMRRTLAGAATLRGELSTKLTRVLRGALVAKMTGEEIKKLESVQATLKGAIGGLALFEKIAEWKVDVAMRGALDLRLRYLQFEEPRLLLARHRRDGEAFYGPISQLGAPDLQTECLELLRAAFRDLGDAGAKIDEKLTWQDIHKDQLARLDKRISPSAAGHRRNLSEECLTLSRELRAKAADVKSIEDYRDFERRFGASVNLCDFGGESGPFKFSSRDERGVRAP